MTKNDIIRRVRYALDINDPTMIEIFRLAGHEIDQSALTNLLKKETDEGYVECDDRVMGYFLDGLILHKRGRRETGPEKENKPASRLTNNAILKKLRIALELKEEDMVAVLNLADTVISKSELSALFRKEGHRNYKECGDQFLRNFLKGLTIRYRGL
ncbi:MAG: DUF1456 family protein [Nitrospirae bacterium]|nr:DUF1456 family protein [Nitrospirota bacterium]